MDRDWDPELDDPTPISGLGGVPVAMPEEPVEGAGLGAGLGAVVNPATSAEPGEVAPPMSQNAAPEDEEDQPVMRARSLGPRPRLLDRRAAPVEAPDWGAAANATGQAAVQSVGAAAAGAPMAAGSAAVGLGRGMATAPDQLLRIYDAVEMAEIAGEAENAPVGGFARVYQAADRAERDRMRTAAGGAQLQRDEAGTGQGLQAVGRSLQGAGRAVFEGADEAARAAFPVAPEREGDFAVRTGRALGAVPAILGAGAVAGPVAMAGMIGSQTYATTFNEARTLLTRGGMSEEEADRRAADAATANAFAQAGLMTVPFIRLLDRMSPGAQRGVLGTLRDMAASGAEFAGSNAVGRVVENVLAREGFDSDRELMREVWESLGPEAVAGAIIPGAGAGARAGARAVAQAAPRATAAPEVREAAGAVEAAMGGGDRAAVEAAIEGFAAATGIPPEVRVRLQDRLLTEGGTAADARYSPDARLIDVALDTDPTLAASRVFHEGAGHAALEFLPARERQALERASDRWLAQPFDVTALRPGADPSAGGGPPPRTNREYLARLNQLDPARPESRVILREEGIAHLAEMHFARSLQERPMVSRAIDRLADTMDRLGSALRGQGFTSAESVFRAMTGGRGDRIGLGDPAQRVLDAPGGEVVPASSRDSARDGPLRAWHGSPHTFAPERGVRLEDGTEVRLRAGMPVDPAVDAAVRDGRATVTEYPMGRFDIGRIGTGEGAQAYGHGLYFAGNRRVAEGYRDDLSATRVETARQEMDLLVGNSRERWLSPDQAGAEMVARADAMERDGAPADAVAQVRALANSERARRAAAVLSESRPGQYGDETPDAVRAWRVLNEEVEKLAPPGSLYEVDLHVQPDRMLDWDRLAAEQPGPVRDALADIGVDPRLPRSEWGERRGPRGQDIPLMESRADGRFYEVGFVRERPGGWWEVFAGSPGMQRSIQHQPSLDAAREVLHDMTVGRNRPMTGARAMLLAGAMSPGDGGQPGSPATAARALRDRGVQGVRYLDGMSRDAGNGTRNVVTFADDVVEILNRYSAREGGGRRPPIEGLPEVDAGADRIGGSDIRARRRAGKVFLQTLRDEVNAAGGIPARALGGARVMLSGRGIGKVIGHAGDDVLDALPAVADLIARGSLWETQPGQDPATAAMHIIAANVNTGGAVEPMRAHIRQTADGRYFYDFGTMRGEDPAGAPGRSGPRWNRGGPAGVPPERPAADGPGPDERRQPPAAGEGGGPPSLSNMAAGDRDRKKSERRADGGLVYPNALGDDGSLEGVQAARVSENKSDMGRPGVGPEGGSSTERKSVRSAPARPTGNMAPVPAPRKPSDESLAHGGLVGVPALASGGLAAPEMDARGAGLPQGQSATAGVVSGLGTPPTIGGGTPDPETRGALQGLEMWRAAAAML